MPSASSYTKAKVDSLLSGYSPSPVKLCSFRFDDPTSYAASTKFGTGPSNGRLFLPRPTAADIPNIDQTKVIEYYVHPDLIDDGGDTGGMRKTTWMSTFGPGMLIYRYYYYFEVATTTSNDTWHAFDLANTDYDDLGYEWYYKRFTNAAVATRSDVGTESIFIDDTWPTDDVGFGSAYSATNDVLAWHLRQARVNMVFYPNGVV